MVGRIVVHTVYVIIIIMCYFIVSCIPVLIIILNKKIKKIIHTGERLRCSNIGCTKSFLYKKSLNYHLKTCNR